MREKSKGEQGKGEEGAKRVRGNGEREKKGTGKAEPEMENDLRLLGVFRIC
jgi:hypothetical protein